MDRGRYRYVACVECGTIQLDPLLSEKEIRAAYASEYPPAGVRRDLVHPLIWRRTHAALHWALIEAMYRFAAPGPVLDFQCGWGSLVALLSESCAADGYVPYGVDLSWKMAAHCSDHGLPVANGSLEEAAASGVRASAILSAGGFERVPDPRAALLGARSILADGGHIIAAQASTSFTRRFGNIQALASLAPGCTLAPPWSVSILSIRGMHAVAAECGFRILDVRKAPLVGGLGPAGRLLEATNRAGYALAGLRWPFIPGLVFVLRKENRASLSVL